ncbi:MAG: HEAT repeat domain-containing protein [bacterium]
MGIICLFRKGLFLNFILLCLFAIISADVRFIATADYTNALEAEQDILARGFGVDFHLSAGDLNQTTIVGITRPLYVAWGNHGPAESGREAELTSTGKMPLIEHLKSGGSWMWRYTKDFENLRIVFCGYDGSYSYGATPISEQGQDYISSSFSQSGAEWKIVACHFPVMQMFNTSTFDSKKMMAHAMVSTVLEQNNVDIYIHGHDHFYGRTYPVIMENDTIPAKSREKGVVYMDVGGCNMGHGTVTPVAADWLDTHGWFTYIVVDGDVLRISAYAKANYSTLHTCFSKTTYEEFDYYVKSRDSSYESGLLAQLNGGDQSISIIKELGGLVCREAAQPIAAVFNGAAGDLRRECARALSRISNAAVLEDIKAAVNDPDPVVRRYLIRYLWKAGGEAEAPFLTELAAHTSDRITIRWAVDKLAMLPGNDARGLISGWLNQGKYPLSALRYASGKNDTILAGVVIKQILENADPSKPPVTTIFSSDWGNPFNSGDYGAVRPYIYKCIGIISHVYDMPSLIKIAGNRDVSFAFREAVYRHGQARHIVPLRLRISSINSWEMDVMYFCFKSLGAENITRPQGAGPADKTLLKSEIEAWMATQDLKDEDEDGMEDAWESLYGLNPGLASDSSDDADNDGDDNWTEYVNNTDPKDPLSRDDRPDEPAKAEFLPGKSGNIKISLQCYPNPSLGKTAVNFIIPEKYRYDKSFSLAVYDLAGRLVNRLNGNFYGMRNYRAVWTGCDKNGFAAANGTYMVVLDTKDSKFIKAMVLMR